VDGRAALAGSGRLGAELEAVAERLRRITVRLRSGRLGEGAGVIWSHDGLVLSNAHVVHAEPLVIELWDGRRFDAQLRWRDPRHDLAVIAIRCTGLPAAVPGDATALRSGQLVLALGHPFGLGNALSLGVVHQPPADLGRNRWIRADISLAPGNSGGPLANAAGEVIGLNTLVAGGLGHAIPISVVQRLLQQRGERAA
jgi:serine protease Do